jgi:hypothetical protein
VVADQQAVQLIGDTHFPRVHFAGSCLVNFGQLNREVALQLLTEVGATIQASLAA